MINNLTVLMDAPTRFHQFQNIVLQLVSTSFSMEKKYCGFPPALFTTWRKSYIEPESPTFYLELAAFTAALSQVYGKDHEDYSHNLTEESFSYTKFARRQLSKSLGYSNASIVIYDWKTIEMPVIARPPSSVALTGSAEFVRFVKHICVKLKKENKLTSHLEIVVDGLPGLADLFPGLPCFDIARLLEGMIFGEGNDLLEEFQHKIHQTAKEIYGIFDVGNLDTRGQKELLICVNNAIVSIVRYLVTASFMQYTRNNSLNLSDKYRDAVDILYGYNRQHFQSEIEQQAGLFYFEDGEITLLKLESHLRKHSRFDDSNETRKALKDCLAKVYAINPVSQKVTQRGTRLLRFILQLFSDTQEDPDSENRIEGKVNRWNRFQPTSTNSKVLSLIRDSFSPGENQVESMVEGIRLLFEGRLENRKDPIPPIALEIQNEIDESFVQKQQGRHAQPDLEFPERNVIMIPLMPLGGVKEHRNERHAFVVAAVGKSPVIDASVPDSKPIKLSDQLRRLRNFFGVITQVTLALDTEMRRYKTDVDSNYDLLKRIGFFVGHDLKNRLTEMNHMRVASRVSEQLKQLQKMKFKYPDEYQVLLNNLELIGISIDSLNEQLVFCRKLEGLYSLSELYNLQKSFFAESKRGYFPEKWKSPTKPDWNRSHEISDSEWDRSVRYIEDLIGNTLAWHNIAGERPIQLFKLKGPLRRQSFLEIRSSDYEEIKSFSIDNEPEPDLVPFAGKPNTGTIVALGGLVEIVRNAAVYLRNNDKKSKKSFSGLHIFFDIYLDKDNDVLKIRIYNPIVPTSNPNFIDPPSIQAIQEMYRHLNNAIEISSNKVHNGFSRFPKLVASEFIYSPKKIRFQQSLNGS